MNLAAEANWSALIEETLVYASELGMVEHDFRVLSILTTWVGIHHGHMNADRLVRCVSEHGSPRVRAYWSAIAGWLKKGRRFARLGKLYEGSQVDLLPVETEFQIARRGEDERFTGSAVRVPAGTLRDRETDVRSPEVLVRRHTGYQNRVLMGLIWRADLWTELEREPDMSVAEAARRAGCSFSTAWQVVQDFRLLQGASSDNGGDSISAL